MRRRKFIALSVGTAVSWPLAARAQQNDRVRRIGYLSAVAESDPENQSLIRAFTQRLQELGWASSRNVRIDLRFGSRSNAYFDASNRTG